MRPHCVRTVAMLCAVLTLATRLASADTIITQGFLEDDQNAIPFNQMTVSMSPSTDPAVMFATPAFTGLGGWIEVSDGRNATLTSSQQIYGPLVFFVGVRVPDRSTPFTFTFQPLLDGQPTNVATTMEWTGKQWNVTGPDAVLIPDAPLPSTASVSLVLLGAFLGVGRCIQRSRHLVF